MLLTTTLSFAQTNSLTLGCPTRNGSGDYLYSNLDLNAGDGDVRSISISFSDDPEDCSINLPADTPSGWSIAASSNIFSKYITLPEGVSATDIENYLRLVSFSVPDNTIRSVSIIMQTNISGNVIYYSDNGHYYQYVPFTDSEGDWTWIDCYNAAKEMEYCGRQGYLATLTSLDEDKFVTRLVATPMWVGGTRLSPTDNDTSSSTQYYASFDTDDEPNADNTDYWYWACGPEKGMQITPGVANPYQRESQHNNAVAWWNTMGAYSNWMYIHRGWNDEHEPNNYLSNGGESCLVILSLSTRNSEEGHTPGFGWADIGYDVNAIENGDSYGFDPDGYLVEYGDQFIGDSQPQENECSISASGLVGNAPHTVKATLSGDTAVCAGKEATLNIIFEGGAFPFTGSVQGNNGAVVHTFNTNDISYNFTVAPDETTSYTISTFSDASSTTGSNGCTGVYNIIYETTGSVTVTVNTPQVALKDIASVAICAGASTTLTAELDGTPTGNVAYAWSPATGLSATTGATVTANPSETTTYTVTATATQGGCTATATKEVTVTVNTPQVALKDIASVAICAGASTTLTAELDGTPTGNVAYAWSPATGLSATTGATVTANPSETTTYTVTATATQGECTATATKEVTVTVNALPTATVSVTDVKCKGASNGSVELSVSGGTTPYSYAWSNGATTEDLSSVSAGTYTVTVTDDNGCTAATASATVSQPAALTVSLEPESETCAGNDGSVALTVSGGTTPYSYAWSNGDTTKNLSSVPAGPYTVTVTDNNECTTTATATITLNKNFTVSASDTAICSGATFTINPEATHTAKYSWAAPTATDITGAAAGTNASNISGTLTNTDTSATSITYTVAATTANGLCTADSFDVEVTVYAPVTGGSIQKDSIVCNVADTIVKLTNVTAGNGGYGGTYGWEKSTDNGTTWTTIPNSNGAEYTPSYHDNLGTVLYRRMYSANCDKEPSNTVSVTYYGNILAGDVICTNGCDTNYCSGSNISVTLRTSGITIQSNAPYSIQWQQSTDNGASWTDISGDTSDTYTYTNSNFTSPIQFRYTITVTGCAAVPSNSVHKIGVWELPVVSIAEVATLCPSAASTDIKGTIETTTTPNYTYHWIPGSGLELSNLPQSDTSATSDTITGTFPTADCNATYSASLYVIDGHGCQSNTDTVTFTVVDTEAPVISGTLDTINVEGCTVSAAPAAYTTVAALRTAGLNITDNCGLQETVTSKQTSTGSCPIVITRTYTVKDLCGDSATVSQTININQADFTMPANGSSTIHCASELAEPTLPVVKDACNNVLSPIGEPVISATPECDGTVTYTYTYKDCANHSHNWVYTYTIEHEDFTMPANDSSTVDCPSATDTPPTLPTITDACGDTLSPIGDPVVSTKPVCEGKRTYTYTYRDCAGHSHEWVYTYTVERPTLTFSGSINDVENVNACYSDTHKLQLLTAEDVKAMYRSSCSREITVSTNDEVVSSSDCNWKITRTYNISDGGCNIDSKTMSVSGSDRTDPFITCNENLTPNTDNGQPYATVTLQDPTPVDNCSATYSISYSPATPTNATATNASGQYPLGETIVTYSVVDGCGNADSCSFTITVSDNQAPEITCEVTVNQDVVPNSAGNTYTHSGNSWDATATDNVAVTSLTYTLTGATDDDTPKTTLDGQVFNYGTTTVTWKATDNTGAIDVCSFQVVVADNTNPVLTCPTITTVYECLAEVPATYANYAAFTAADGTATDNHQINESSFAVTETVTPGCPTTITRTYSIKDMTGNEGTCTQVITVEDKTAPALTGTWPANITGQNNCFANRNISGLYSNDQVKALYSDCSALTVTSRDTVTGDDCGWTVTRTYTITDACNNSVTDTMSVSGSDQTAPALTGTWPSNITGQDNCFANAVTSGLYTDDQVKALYSDCSTITVTHTDANTLTSDCGWTITRTYTIKDACNNTVTPAPTMSVSGSDQTAPALTGTWPSNITGQDNCFANAVTSGLYTDDQVKALYSDCSTITVTHTDANTLTSDCGWTITRTYTIKDACNNTVTPAPTMSVSGSDQTAPALTGTWPEDITGQDNCFANAVTSGLYTDDQVKALYSDCSAITVTHTDAKEGNACGWTVTRTYTITDSCTNSVTKAMSVSGSDRTAPVLTGTWPSDITGQNSCLSNADTTGLKDDSEIKVLYSDCSTITVTHTDAIEGNACGWTVTRTYTITDSCNNTVTKTMSVSGSDQTAPALTGTWPEDITGQDNCFANAVTSGLYTDDQVKALYSDCSTITVTHTDANTLTDNCGWTITRTYTIKDACNNTVTKTMSVSGSDQTAPALNGTWPDNITGQDNCFANADISGLLSDNDVKALYSDCSTITVTHTDANTLTDDCGWTITRAYIIKDACGNTVTPAPAMSVSGSDQTAPVLAGTWPSDSTGQNSCLANADTTGLKDDSEIKALYSDCSTITVTHTDTIEGNACGWIVTRTYTIKDSCGNTVTPAPTMSVSGSDRTAPAIGTDDLNRTLTSTNCVFTIPDMREIVRNISTDCSEITVTQPSAGMEVYPMVAERDTTVNVIVTDSCGNSSVKEVVITIPAKVTISATATPATICYGATSQLTATPANVVGTATYNWTPSDGLNNATIANPVATLTTTTTYTVEVTDENGCAATATTTVNVNPEVVMDTVAPMTLCVGDVTSYSFTTPLTVGTMSYAWTNSNNAIGLAASGNGNIPSFTPTNTTNAPINATITVTPSHTYNGITCVGDPINFTITVRPSIKTPGNVEFACPADTTVVLSYSDCEQVVNIGEPEFVNNMIGMDVDITNDAPAGNIFPEGTTVVTWTATDDCGDTLTCTQSVVIQFPPCGDTIADFDGYRYSSVRIGCQCWTGENARSEHYSDGTPVDNFRYYNDSDSLENIYGKLYTWYTAVRVPEGDNNAEPSISTDPFGTTYVQGICPEGWALPTVNEYMLMIANSGDATHAKDGSNLYWLPGYEGQPPFSGFDAYGAGKYNGAIDRYQELLGKTYFWTTLSGSGSETATTVEINYYCAEGLQTELSKGDGVSIRCIRKR